MFLLFNLKMSQNWNKLIYLRNYFKDRFIFYLQVTVFKFKLENRNLIFTNRLSSRGSTFLRRTSYVINFYLKVCLMASLHIFTHFYYGDSEIISRTYEISLLLCFFMLFFFLKKSKNYSVSKSETLQKNNN